MRGHGDSAPLWSGNAWLSMNLDLGMLARHLGSPVRFVSHSFGGGQALCTAAAFPDDVKWVVSIDGLGPPAAAFEERDPVEMTATALRVDRAGLGAGRAAVPVAGRHGATSAEDQRAHERRVGRASGAARLASGRDGGFEWKFDPMFNIGLGGPFSQDMLLAEYEMVRCPVLVLTGAEPDAWNDLTPGERAERIAAIGDCRHHEIAGAGHYVHLEQPDAVVEQVRHFIDEVGP